MAEPPDPTTPGGPVDEPDDGGWVRPSQRRRPPRDEPTAGPEPTADDPEPAEATPAAGPDPTAEGSDPTEAANIPAAVAATAPVTSAATRQRRRARHRNRRRVAIGAVALVVAIVAAFVLTSGGGSSRAAPPKVRRAPVTTTTSPGAPPALIATTKVASLQVFEAPSPAAKVVTTLSAKTDYGLPRTLLATGTQPGWYQVLLPIRPNGSQGWVRATDVTTSSTDYAVRVTLSTHHLTLVKSGVPVFDTSVVIGTAKTPTPTGLFYVTDPVDLQASPNGPYGAFALGLSGFSNVLTSFDGGPGQIAVHGTPYADQVGQDLSNGCVRIPNNFILILAKTVPLGTPVAISA